MKTDAQLISERLFTFLNERNLTVNRLATLSGVPQTTLNGIVNGESKNPRVGTIRKLCKALGISYHDFFDFPPYNEVGK